MLATKITVCAEKIGRALRCEIGEEALRNEIGVEALCGETGREALRNEIGREALRGEMEVEALLCEIGGMLRCDLGGSVTLRDWGKRYVRGSRG